MTDEIFSVPDLIKEQLRLLKLNQERLAHEMTSGLAGSPGAGVNDQHVKIATEIAKSIKVLGEELRQWAGTENKAFDRLTPARKLQAVIAFIGTMPRAERVRTYRRLKAAEDALEVDAIHLEVTDAG